MMRYVCKYVLVIQKLKKQLLNSKIKEENVRTAFTFGRSLKAEDLDRQDYKHQFDYIINAMNAKMKRKNSLQPPALMHQKSTHSKKQGPRKLNSMVTDMGDARRKSTS